MERTDAQASVWQQDSAVQRRGPNIGHFVITALFIGIGTVVGAFGSLAVPLGFVSAFWPGQALQAVGGIWFGLWGGGIAAVIFPFFSNAIAGISVPISLLYVPANFAQGMIPAWAFRHFKADPALKTRRDYVIWTVWGVLIPNLFGSLWGSAMLAFVIKAIPPSAWFFTWLGWFVGNSLPSLILGAILLKALSPLVVRTRVFCRGYLS